MKSGEMEGIGQKWNMRKSKHNNDPGKQKAALAGGGTEPEKASEVLVRRAPASWLGRPGLEKREREDSKIVWLLLPDEHIVPDFPGRMLDKLRTICEVFVNSSAPGRCSAGGGDRMRGIFICGGGPGKWGELCAARCRNSCTGARPCGGGDGSAPDRGSGSG